MKIRAFAFSLMAALAFLSTAYAAPSSDGHRVAVSSRGDQSVDIWVEAPQVKDPKWVVVLYPGGLGGLGVRDSGPKSRDNFVIRSAHHWLDYGYGVVMVDTPSDHKDGVSYALRMTDAAFKDTQAVVQAARLQFPGAKVALVATSAGTLTVGNALVRDSGAADAFILTSSVMAHGSGGNPIIGDLNAKPGSPVLVVSNKDDRCPLTPAYSSKRWAEKNKADYIEVEADNSRGDQCGPFSPHGFLGIETQVLEDMHAWLLGH
jgi:alpha-beta hydrolase superfamily lysophospholipase